MTATTTDGRRRRLERSVRRRVRIRVDRPHAAIGRRVPANRRLHLVELTPAGEVLFLRLRDAATAFDRRLRAGLSEGDVGQLEALLTRLRDNVSGG